MSASKASLKSHVLPVALSFLRARLPGFDGEIELEIGAHSRAGLLIAGRHSRNVGMFEDQVTTTAWTRRGEPDRRVDSMGMACPVIPRYRDDALHRNAADGILCMPVPNQTMNKFGYPATIIQDYDRWCVQLRPAQATLGSLVLICKDDAKAFPAISPEAFGELKRVLGDIEISLAAFRRFRKINYLMLMMVDPDVHFHVLPRYDETQHFEGIVFPDRGWPGVPELGDPVVPDDEVQARLIADLKSAWATLCDTA